VPHAGYGLRVDAEGESFRCHTVRLSMRLPRVLSGGAFDRLYAVCFLRLSRVRRLSNPYGLGTLFVAVAPLVYITYHLDWTVFLFAHNISQVLDLDGFVLRFVAAAAQLLGQHRSVEGDGDNLCRRPRVSSADLLRGPMAMIDRGFP
jgi:hypothetical protein